MPPIRTKHAAEFDQAKHLFYDWKLDNSKKMFTQLSHNAKTREDEFYGVLM